MLPPSTLREPQKLAFIALLRSTITVVRKINLELERAGLMSMEMYDILLALEDVPGRRLRMGELSEALVISRSGITRLVDKLEDLGYVHREIAPDDRRSTFVVLDEAGLAAREATWPPHRVLIAEAFGQFYADDEAETLRSLLTRVYSANGTA